MGAYGPRMSPDPTFPPEPAVAGDEPHTFLGSLERQRRTFAWQVSGLDRDGMDQQVGASTLTLAKLVKHLAHMEDLNFSHAYAGRPLPEPWASWDRDADPDWLWRTAGEDDPDDLRALWREAVARSRAVVDEALADGGMGRPGRYATGDGEHVSLRRFVADLVEEYARHVGHADLLREAVDGQVGEDPPADFRG